MRSVYKHIKIQVSDSVETELFGNLSSIDAVQDALSDFVEEQTEFQADLRIGFHVRRLLFVQLKSSVTLD